MSGVVQASEVRDGASFLRHCLLSLGLCVPRWAKVLGEALLVLLVISSLGITLLWGRDRLRVGKLAGAADGESGLMPRNAPRTHPGGCVSHFPSLQTRPSYSSFPLPALLYQTWLSPLLGAIELCEIPASSKTSIKEKSFLKPAFSHQSPLRSGFVNSLIYGTGFWLFFFYMLEDEICLRF